MTRINANLPMHYLSDQLLVNELGEITRVIRSVATQNVNLKNIPEQFTFNKGHVTFFYNKLLFILNRYMNLRKEHFKRTGNHYSEQHMFEVHKYYNMCPDALKNDWSASNGDNSKAIERILERSKGYKRTHTYYGKDITDWRDFMYQNMQAS